MDNENLKRIADALEEILRLVKEDQKKYTAREAREMLQSEENQTQRLNTLFPAGAFNAPAGLPGQL